MLRRREEATKQFVEVRKRWDGRRRGGRGRDDGGGRRRGGGMKGGRRRMEREGMCMDVAKRRKCVQMERGNGREDVRRNREGLRRRIGSEVEAFTWDKGRRGRGGVLNGIIPSD